MNGCREGVEKHIILSIIFGLLMNVIVNIQKKYDRLSFQQSCSFFSLFYSPYVDFSAIDNIKSEYIPNMRTYTIFLSVLNEKVSNSHGIV